MRRISVLFAAMLVWTCCRAEDKLQVADFSASAGAPVTMNIALENPDAQYSAIQVDLYLPEGIEIEKQGDDYVYTLSRVADSHSLSIGKMNGYYRLILSSAMNGEISGNTGTVIGLSLKVSSNLVAGTLNGSLKKIKMVKKDGTGKIIEESPFHIEISDLLRGDANGDGEVNVSDIVEIVNDIMDKTSAKFVKAAADMNGDGDVNVTDIVMVVSIIMSTNHNGARVMMSAAENTDHDLLMLNKIDDHTVSLALHNSGSYIAAQFDVRLSEGATLESMRLNGHRCNGHNLTYSKIGENLYRVVVYSLENHSFADNAGELLNIRTIGNGEIEIDQILFITDQQTEKRFSPLNTSTTGILTIDRTEDVDVYSIEGRLLRRQSSRLEGLKKGVYIVNGKKYIVR